MVLSSIYQLIIRVQIISELVKTVTVNVFETATEYMIKMMLKCVINCSLILVHQLWMLHRKSSSF